MKALDAIARLGNKVVVESAIDGSGSWQVSIENSKWVWNECSKDDLAKAAVIGLAALYDAEHPVTPA
jgi:hypothetical protein